MSTPEVVIELALNFNRIINKLMRQLLVKEKTAEMDRMRQRVNLLINATPLLLLEQGSPYIWNYRDDLKNMYNADTGEFDWSIFINKDYSVHYSTTASAEIHTFVQTVKRIFTNVTDDDKETIYDDLCDAVSVIAKYRKFCKENGLQLHE